MENLDNARKKIAELRAERDAIEIKAEGDRKKIFDLNREINRITEFIKENTPYGDNY